jgi:hypothetical protein
MRKNPASIWAEMAGERDEMRRASSGAHETSLAPVLSWLVEGYHQLARLMSHEFPEPRTRLTYDETELGESRSRVLVSCPH